MDFVGKYVCYGSETGGFCWGKIKAEVKVNTPKGEKPAFILTDRLTCVGPPYTVGNVSRHDRDTLIRQDLLNLETDVIDRDISLSQLNDEEIFVVMMGGEIPDGVNTGQNKAFMNILKFRSESGGLMESAAEELRHRLEE